MLRVEDNPCLGRKTFTLKEVFVKMRNVMFLIFRSDNWIVFHTLWI